MKPKKLLALALCAMAKTTIVLRAVARFELTPSIPTFAKIDVNAANTADNNANTAHIFITS